MTLLVSLASYLWGTALRRDCSEGRALLLGYPRWTSSCTLLKQARSLASMSVTAPLLAVASDAFPPTNDHLHG